MSGGFCSLLFCGFIFLPSVWPLQLKAHQCSSVSVTTALPSPQSQSHFCCLPARPLLTRGSSALKTEPAMETKGGGGDSEQEQSDANTRMGKKTVHKELWQGGRRGPRKKPLGQGEMKVLEMWNNELLLCCWTGCVVFIQREVVYRTDEKSTAIRWWAISVCVSGGVHYYTSLLVRREKNRVHFNCPLV